MWSNDGLNGLANWIKFCSDIDTGTFYLADKWYAFSGVMRDIAFVSRITTEFQVVGN